MSISDMIVVMKEGIVQQIGRPQQVYDSPANLFVAKFLGTPPINVFQGKVRKGMLYIGEDAVLKLQGADSGEDREVYAAVRPEGFLLQEEGPLHCELSGIEVMGRDISVVSKNSASENPAIRAIIGAENGIHVERMLSAHPEKRTVRFALMPHKVFLFDKETEERIYVNPTEQMNGGRL